jgi:hypothetical protein
LFLVAVSGDRHFQSKVSDGNEEGGEQATANGYVQRDDPLVIYPLIPMGIGNRSLEDHNIKST